MQITGSDTERGILAKVMHLKCQQKARCRSNPPFSGHWFYFFTGKVLMFQFSQPQLDQSIIITVCLCTSLSRAKLKNITNGNLPSVHCTTWKFPTTCKAVGCSTSGRGTVHLWSNHVRNMGNRYSSMDKRDGDVFAVITYTSFTFIGTQTPDQSGCHHVSALTIQAGIPATLWLPCCASTHTHTLDSNSTQPYPFLPHPWTSRTSSMGTALQPCCSSAASSIHHSLYWGSPEIS